MDYDRRLQAYSSLRAEAWAGMGTVQALPLLHQSLADIRRTDDLAIRSAAAQALGRLITAAQLDSARVETLQGERDELRGPTFCPAAHRVAVDPSKCLNCTCSGIAAARFQCAGLLCCAGDMKGKRAVDLVHTVLFQQLRRTVPAPNLAVRQVPPSCCHGRKPSLC